MLLESQKAESIRNRNVTFVKKCKELEYFKDYNEIFNFLEFNDVSVRLKNEAIIDNQVFITNSGVIQIEGVQVNKEVNLLQDLIYNLVYQNINITRCDSHIFMSLKSGSSNEHSDKEDVHLFGLFGTTVYRVYYDDEMRFEDYEIERGDYLYIPYRQKHRSISKTPRAVLSVGFFFT